MEKEKLDKTIKAGMEQGLTADEWYVAMLTSIASSLAVIADKLTEENGIAKNETAVKFPNPVRR